MKPYDHRKIERKWQKTWTAKKVYKTLDAKSAQAKGKKPYYVLDMFPYPSGAGLHVGHPRGYIASDIFARMKRMQGYNVLHPMGFDSFGLPAEQYAIQTGKNPSTFTKQLVKRYKEQLSILGFSYDWDRQVATHDPEYYRWTQWIFLQIYNSWYDKSKNPSAGGKARPIDELIKIFEKSGNQKIDAVCDESVQAFSAKDWKAFSDLEKQNILMKYRLAYEGYAEVNWCAELGTVLANDEVVEKDGNMVSERGEYPVIKKTMRQWFMRITAYADRLLSGLETIDWSNSIKEIQKNWIGKSEGSEISFEIKGLEGEKQINVFTTRADTLFGVTYMVLAPEHTLIDQLKPQIKNWNEVEQYITSVKSKSDEDRTSAKEKTGVQLQGIFAVNPAYAKLGGTSPANNEQVYPAEAVIPVWIADYVLAGYGTGAIMAVPAHDERDREFAIKFDLPIIDRPLVDIQKITKQVGGKLVTKYKMRDAIFARQRYWGEPIPLIYGKDGMITPIKENALPLKLPNVKSYEPSGNGEGPLATVPSWVKSGYETNTMPGWAGSSWYFLRYIDPKNKKSFASQQELDYWFPATRKALQDKQKNDGVSAIHSFSGGVNMYVGGSEHATGHLLYSRFWHKVLKDLGYVKTEEPFQTLRNQGMIGGADGRKMSKRYGNVINPDDVVAQFGADTLRVYESFMGPFEAHLPWSTDGIVGSRRFIERIWRFAEKVSDEKTAPELEKVLHKTIKKVTDDIADFGFNTAVSAMMIFANELEKHASINTKDWIKFLQILAPFAPHITDELYGMIETAPSTRGGAQGAGVCPSIHTTPWPTYDPKKVIDDTITIGVQINGKVRAEITLTRDEDKNTLRDRVLEIPEIIKWTQGTPIKKFIYIPGKIINIVL